MFIVRGQVFGARSGKPLSAAVERVFARLPRPRTLDAKDSYFGVHIPLEGPYLEIARALGARWVRLHDGSQITKWPTVEPSPGDLRFFDQMVDSARAAGLCLLGSLDGLPPWVGGTAKPEDAWEAAKSEGVFERFARYVRAVADHYKGRIDHWEVWNEPWNEIFYRGSPDDYATLLRVAYGEVKRANPQAVVLGLTASPTEESFVERALAPSGTAHFDALSYHDYDGSLYGGPQNRARRIVGRFQEIQGRYGAVRPMWMTEGGPGETLGSLYDPEQRGFPARGQLAYAVRFDVSHLAAGAQRVFLYTLHGEHAAATTSYTALEHDLAIKPILAARAVLASMIDGAAFVGREESEPGLEAYRFRHRDGEEVLVLWNYVSDAIRPAGRLPPGARVFDVEGNPIAADSLVIGPEPTYVVTR